MDEQALDAALASGRLGGAALDVVEQGHGDGRHFLLRHDNVVLTPHLGGATHETLLQGAEMIAEEIQRFAAQQPLGNVVNRAGGGRMSAELLLAIDAGTGSCRAVLFLLDGNQVAIGAARVHHAALPGVPGSQVFDTAANWALICACTREALSDGGRRRLGREGGSATSMREGMVLYDRSGTELWACPNVDSRAGEQAHRARAIGRRPGDLPALGRLGGDHLAGPLAVGPRARARDVLAHRPRRDARRLDPHPALGWFVTDPSLGSSSGMFELAERTGPSGSSRSSGSTAAVFPPVVEPGTVVGQVTAEAAAATGPRRGTPVVVGGADTQLALLGLGVAEPGRFTVVGGTFWQHTVVLDEPLIDPDGRLRTLCHTVPGRWMIEGIGFYCGMVMRWFRDAFCEAENARGRARGRRRLRAAGARRGGAPAGLQRCLRDLLQPDAGESLGARIAGLRRLRRRQPGDGPQRGVPPLLDGAERIAAGGRRVATSKPMNDGAACTQRLACIRLEKIPKTPFEPGGSDAAARSSTS